jgi:hypothetical protein
MSDDRQCHLHCILNLSLKLLLGPVRAEAEREAELVPVALDGIHTGWPRREK